MNIEDVFLEMLKDHIDDIMSGKLPKGKFVGKYMERINSIDRANAHRFKTPQVIGHGKEANNNWLDYIINMPQEEFEYFRLCLG